MADQPKQREKENNNTVREEKYTPASYSASGKEVLLTAIHLRIASAHCRNDYFKRIT